MAKVVENQYVEVHRQERRSRFDGAELVAHARHVLDPRAEYALQLARHFALVSGEPDGVDDTGRQKFKLLSAAQVAERACAVAQAMYDEIEGKGWALPVPVVTYDESGKVTQD